MVSGSFQGFDQTYLLDALDHLGDDFVGVTQLPVTVTDDEIFLLHQAGIRAVRFNLRRGGSEEIVHLRSFARRIFELVGWHVELYVDSRELESLYQTLITLPRVSVDHLGLSRDGFNCLLRLAERGVRVKATGFSRGDLDIKNALRMLHEVNPNALMFGTDLPCTRAPRSYSDEDFYLVVETLGEEAAAAIFHLNALQWYRPGQRPHSG